MELAVNMPAVDLIISRRRSSIARLESALTRLAASQHYLVGETVKGDLHPEFPAGESFVTTCTALDESVHALLIWLEDLVMQSETFTGTFNAQRQ